MSGKSKGVSVLDFEEGQFLDPALEELSSAYKGWQETDGQGNRRLWSMLGKVYELGPKIDQNKSARARLVAKANAHPSVQGKNSWKADRKKSHDLLLVLLLGLKEGTKATKSQWLGAIRAAGEAKIEPEIGKFVSWIETAGGVNAARKGISRKTSTDRKDIGTWVQKLTEFIDDEQELIKLPQICGESTFPGGIGVVLVQNGSNRNEGRPIVTLTNQKLIISAIKALLVQAARNEREWTSGANAEQRKRLEAAKPNWKKHSKTGDFAGTLEEYLNEGCPEY